MNQKLLISNDRDSLGLLKLTQASTSAEPNQGDYKPFDKLGFVEQMTSRQPFAERSSDECLLARLCISILRSEVIYQLPSDGGSKFHGGEVGTSDSFL